MAKTLDQVYNDNTKAYADHVVIPRSMPPDGEYTAQLTAVVDWVGQDDGINVVTIGKIVDGEYQGRDFVVMRAGQTTLGFLKAFAGLILGQTGTPGADVAALKAKILEGVVVQVNVETRPNKQGVEYTNAHVLRVLDNADVA